MEFTTMLGMLGEGFLVTLQLFFVTLIGALPLGVLVALGRMSRFRPISYLFRLYISIMRGTPLMLQLMFIFFAPYYIFGVQLSIHDRRSGDVHYGACHRFSARHTHGFRGSGTVLLGVHLRGRVRHLAHRKAPGLLSRLSEKGTWYD